MSKRQFTILFGAITLFFIGYYSTEINLFFSSSKTITGLFAALSFIVMLYANYLYKRLQSEERESYRLFNEQELDRIRYHNIEKENEQLKQQLKNQKKNERNRTSKKRAA